MMDRFTKIAVQPLMGTRIIESDLAMLPPPPARSDDMRAMVDDLGRHGQIFQKPGAFQLPNGQMIVHPTVFKKLMQATDKRLKTFTDNLFMGAIR